jgi:uncharacterized protein
MKYLLVTALILGVFWLWRHNRQAERDAAAPPRAPAPAAPASAVTEIVACNVCQVHLPKSEALIGREGGVYCSQAHRREAGG